MMRETKLDALTRESDELLKWMQSPKARRALRDAFRASPIRMGKAAVSAARNCRSGTRKRAGPRHGGDA